MKQHQVTFNFADGVSRSLVVAADASILDAALAAKVPLLYQCRSGSCSSCVAQLADGEAHTRPGASSTLLASEYANGQRLLCVCQAQSDCSFDLAYGSEVVVAAAVRVNAFIDSIDRIASNVVRLTLELAEGDWLAFRPGQFMQIEVPGFGVLRSYSPSSTSASLPKLEFLVRLLPGGPCPASSRSRRDPTRCSAFPARTVPSSCAKRSAARRTFSWPAVPGWRRSCR
ncbi:2Fe-2S iron-sulfur cluster-binding protein [Pseudomonas aeruginosa]